MNSITYLHCLHDRVGFGRNFGGHSIRWSSRTCSLGFLNWPNWVIPVVQRVMGLSWLVMAPRFGVGTRVWYSYSNGVLSRPARSCGGTFWSHHARMMRRYVALWKLEPWQDTRTCRSGWGRAFTFKYMSYVYVYININSYMYIKAITHTHILFA